MSTNGSSLRGLNLRERYGEWALVTGASAGIGLEFARAFARAGLSCVLAARREDRLKALGDELSKAHGIQTRAVAVDLAAQDGADKLADAVADLPIGILVNNAGFGYAGRFDKLETDRLRAMVMVNCVAPVVLTSRILPAMVKRGRGAVIIVGSVAGRQPLPLHAVYSATKAFDLSWARDYGPNCKAPESTRCASSRDPRPPSFRVSQASRSARITANRPRKWWRSCSRRSASIRRWSRDGSTTCAPISRASCRARP